MVVWHDLTRFDTFWYFLTPVFGRAPARVKNDRPKLYLFFTILRFFAGQVFKEQRGDPEVPQRGSAPADANGSIGDLEEEYAPSGGIKQGKILYILPQATNWTWWGGKAAEEQGERSKEQGGPVK